MKTKKFLVLGGGTSGWITAHSVRTMFPGSEITVIYSEEKGVVGVGEATTPHIADFLRSINVDFCDFTKKVGGTIKNGISFENWNGDGKKYFHSFNENLADFSIPYIFGHSCFDYYLKTLLNQGLSLDECLYQHRLAHAHKVDVDKTAYAFHFDTNKFSKYLEDLAIERNIKIVKGNLQKAVQDDSGKIVEIATEDNRFECDFVFDCSGFHRVLIGGLYKQSWISYKKHLPMKKAITFWLDKDESLPPYTTSIAMKYGWMWKIPLQDRVGGGYVYDSDYINEQQAKQEAEEYYGRSLDVRKVLDFDAGRYQNIWVKNCIAVGLSGNFIEPLESTSIWLQLTLLTTLKYFLSDIDSLNEKNIELFNELIADDVDEKMNFVYLHYLTKRNDSDFWKEFRIKNPLPKLIEEILPFIEQGSLTFHNLRAGNLPSSFSLSSYLMVCSGLELFGKEIKINNYENLQPSPEVYREIVEHNLSKALTHYQFLKSVGC